MGANGGITGIGKEMSPIYESEEITREKLEEIRKRNVCAACGGWLNTFLDPESGKAFIACHEWVRSEHQGIEREPSRYEMEGLASLNIETRREIMEEQHGEEKTKALGRYMGGGIVMTKSVATEIVETLWGEAPAIEKSKCILLCQTYQLNPLMKHIYLIGYKRYKDKKLVVDNRGNPILDWSIQQGISATRLLAQRKHNYSYLDRSPRKAKQEEIDDILGDTADPNCIYGFVWIRDVDTGAEAFGLRGIERDANIKGTEKGNTHLNMACIRAERLALDRQYPGEMPQDIEVVDERYIEADYRVVDETTGEITESKPKPIEGAVPLQTESKPKEHWCEEHNCAFEEKKSRYGTFWAHKVEGGYCNEKKKKDKAPEPEPELEPEPAPEPQQPKRDPGSIKTINELYKACHDDWGMQPAHVVAELGVSSQSDISDTPADCYRRISAVR